MSPTTEDLRRELKSAYAATSSGSSHSKAAVMERVSRKVPVSLPEHRRDGRSRLVIATWVASIAALALVTALVVPQVINHSSSHPAGTIPSTRPSGRTPLPSGASAPSCETYFGSAAVTAKQFGVPSLDGEESQYGSVQCTYIQYYQPGPNHADLLVLGLTIYEKTIYESHSDLRGAIAVAKSGSVYAYVLTTMHSTFKVSQARDQAWLQTVAARTEPPKPRTSTTVPPEPTATGFEPSGATFVTASQGWVLGSKNSACESCAALKVTSDGGTTWTTLPSPPVQLAPYSQAPTAVDDVYFVNENNGYLYGPGLEVTTDRGHIWTRISLPPVIELVGGDGYTYALTETSYDNGPRLWRSSSGSKSWTALPIPTTNAANGLQVDVEGNTVLLLQHGDSVPMTTDMGALWRSTDGGSIWVKAPVPCTPGRDGGAAVATIALGHPTEWLVDCYNNEESQQEQNSQQHLYGTDNSGLTWVRMSDPTTHGGPILLADNGAGDDVLTTESGIGDSLDATFDYGRTWSSLFYDGGSDFGWADLQFVNSSIGFVVGPTHYAPEHLYRTDDGGRTWRVLTGFK
jgi:photosystem II stability/assembly factor-like uncharacterized protein